MREDILEVMAYYEDLIKEYSKTRIWQATRLGYVPSRLRLHPSIKNDIWFTTRRKHPLSLELGCGYGNNVVHAAMHGFKAYGVDIRKHFVDQGNMFIEDLKSKKLIDKSVHAKLFYGNMFTKDMLHDLKKHFMRYAAVKLKIKKKEIKKRLDRQMKTSLEFLTDDEFKRYFDIDSPNGLRVQRFELYATHQIKDDDSDEVTPRLILENPHGDKDVYDIMGKNFNDFDMFYTYAWNETNITAETIRRHHPRPYVWFEQGSSRNHEDYPALNNYKSFKQYFHDALVLDRW